MSIKDKEEYDKTIAANEKEFDLGTSEQAKYARAWTVWENSLASFNSFGTGYVPSIEYSKAFARIENHYFINACFLECDELIVRDLHFIKNIPTIIVQGRFDMICPPETADKVHRSLPNSKLILVKDAGHAMSEPNISKELIKATNEFKN